MRAARDTTVPARDDARALSASASDAALSPALRLLLACCRAHPDTADILARLARVPDPARLTALARHHLVLPLVYARLKAALATLPEGDASTPAWLAEMAAESRKAAMANLLQQAELDQLARQHLRPRDIGYLVVKGLSLAARYYPDISLRQSRDIDLLVEPARLHGLVEDMLAQGYRLLAAPQVRTARDLRAYCRMNGEINMASPRGVLVQVHQLLDFSGCQFSVPASELIARAESCAHGARAYPVLGTTDLFVYICHHHGRHQWSRLHWLADLDALLSHRDFDLAAVNRRARQLGLAPVVSAALALHALLFRATAPSADAPAFQRGVIAGCLHFLREDSDPPERLRDQERRSGSGIARTWMRQFAYNWRSNTAWRNRVCYLLSVWKPTYADYLFLPLPLALHGLYAPLRPLRWGVEIMRGRPTGQA
jgi:hypothetical protein